MLFPEPLGARDCGLVLEAALHFHDERLAVEPSAIATIDGSTLHALDELAEERQH